MECISRLIIQKAVKPDNVLKKDRSSNLNVPKVPAKRVEMGILFMLISSYSIFRVPS